MMVNDLQFMKQYGLYSLSFHKAINDSTNKDYMTLECTQFIKIKSTFEENTWYNADIKHRFACKSIIEGWEILKKRVLAYEVSQNHSNGALK